MKMLAAAPPSPALATLSFPILLLLLPALVHAQSRDCLDACIEDNLTSTDCDPSTQSGTELDTCMCETYMLAGPLIGCVRECPEDEIALYAANIPELCREDIFPGVEVPDEEVPKEEEEEPTETGTGGAGAEETDGPESGGPGGSAGVMGYDVPRVGVLVAVAMGGLCAALVV